MEAGCGSDGNVAIVAQREAPFISHVRAPVGYGLNTGPMFAHPDRSRSGLCPEAMNERLDWIFFDCFDTLLVEPRSGERFPYLTPSADLPVQFGLYASRAEFLDDYARWYASRWPGIDGAPASGQDWAEVPLATRLMELFQDRRKRMASGSNRSANGEAPELDAIVSQMVSRLGDHYLRTLTPTDGVQDLLSELQGRVKMAVVSNFYIVGWPEFVLDRFGLGRHFEFVLDSAAFGVKKPGPAIYEEALRRSAARPRNVVFVGDSLANDVLAPRRFGMRALHYRPENGGPAAGADADVPARDIISHWRDLPPILSL